MKVVSKTGKTFLVEQEWGENRWNVSAKEDTPCKLLGSEWSFVEVFNSQEDAINYARNR